MVRTRRVAHCARSAVGVLRLEGGGMTGSCEWFDVTTIGSRGRARAMPSALAPGGVQVEFQFATGRALTITFTAVETGELRRQLGMTLEIQGGPHGALDALAGT
jgi:hypothetical protein